MSTQAMFPFRSRPCPLRLEPLEDRLLPAGLAAADPDAVPLTQLPQYSSPAPADPSASSDDDSDDGDGTTPESGYSSAPAASPGPSALPSPHAPAGGPPLPAAGAASPGPENGEVPAVPVTAGGPDAVSASRGGPVPRDGDDHGPKYDEPRVLGWAVSVAASASPPAGEREGLARADVTREAAAHPHQLVLANAPPPPPLGSAGPASTPVIEPIHANGPADRADEQSAVPFDPSEITPAPSAAPEPSASESPGGTKPEVFVGLPLAGVLPMDFPALEAATREFLGRIADLGADLAEAPDRYLILAGALVAAGAAHAVWVGRNRERMAGRLPGSGRAPT